MKSFLICLLSRGSIETVFLIYFARLGVRFRIHHPSDLIYKIILSILLLLYKVGWIGFWYELIGLSKTVSLFQKVGVRLCITFMRLHWIYYPCNVSCEIRQKKRHTMNFSSRNSVHTHKSIQSHAGGGKYLVDLAEVRSKEKMFTDYTCFLLQFHE